MALKDWKKESNKKDGFVFRTGMPSNILLVGSIHWDYNKWTEYWTVGINSTGEDFGVITIKKIYGNKSSALKFAKEYMRTH